MEYIAKQPLHASENPLLQMSYLHTGATFSHALSSLPLCLVSTSSFSLPSDPPPGEKEGKRGSTKYRHFPPPPPPPPPFSLKTTAVIPNACQRATELDSVYMCARMWMSVQPLDWTRIHSLFCWLWFLLSTAKKFWNTLYKAKKVAWGSLWFRYPKRESKSCPGADSNCIPLYPSLC